MRVFIVTMDDPIETVSFIKKIINTRINWIIGVAIVKGGRLSISKNKSKWKYLLSLLLIMGPLHFAKYTVITLLYKLKIKLGNYSTSIKKKTLQGWLESRNITVRNISNVSDSEFLNYLKNLNIDVIIHQSQSILKADFLNIPKIGTINRHHSLLPKNRGRLTPFWVLYHEEKETGISIHFVSEKIDAGSIIVQKKYTVKPNDSFNSLVNKSYKLAPSAMIEALDKLHNGITEYLPNNNNEATYNTIPDFNQALKFRIKRICKSFKYTKNNFAF